MPCIRETITVEVVQTLVGSIGLVASVPLTTLLAALGDPGPAIRRRRRREPAPRRQAAAGVRPRSRRGPALDNTAPALALGRRPLRLMAAPGSSLARRATATPAIAGGPARPKRPIPPHRAPRKLLVSMA